MKIVSSQHVSEMIQSKKKAHYSSIIERLQQGAALRIAPSEWHQKTSIPLYFLGLMNRGGKKRVSVIKMIDGDYYVIKVS